MLRAGVLPLRGYEAPSGRHHGVVTLVLCAPTHPLTDGTIYLRLPHAGDVAVLVEYSMTPSGLEGVWLPIAPSASRERLAWIVDDWLRGWAGEESLNGPALLLDVGDASHFVGIVGFGARERGVVELVYGVAPAWRRRGLGIRAALLATSWLVAERHVRAVELRIGREHRASQRVAEKAGYQLAGTVRQRVQRTGEQFEDLRYIYSSAGDARPAC
jgi:RimJ/RimL family protein N-acetyltransferase